MKPTRYEKFQDFMLSILRRVCYLLNLFHVKTTYTLNDGLKFNRKEPYVMVGNHTYMLDVIQVPMRWKTIPFIVASQSLFAKKSLNFLLTKVAHAVPKSKGSSDIRTVKMLITAIRKGYGILIFPEGDTTFQGQTNYIEESTYKLIKKMKVDVITCKASGGYLSMPRWATGKRKNRRAHFEYSIAIKKEDLKTMSVEEIKEVVEGKLFNNDYDYQREHMIEHKGKQLAMGIDNVIYSCPNCGSVHTIKADGNKLTCHNCKTEGHVDNYGFIQGFKFDNLVEWDQYQKEQRDELRKSSFESKGELYFADYKTDVRELQGDITLRYENGNFIIKGIRDEIIPLSETKNTILTLRTNLNFTYNETNYVVKLDKYMFSFLRVTDSKY